MKREAKSTLPRNEKKPIEEDVESKSRVTASLERKSLEVDETAGGSCSYASANHSFVLFILRKDRCGLDRESGDSGGPSFFDSAVGSVRTTMAFVSFVGRVLFASIFLLSAWQEFNEYGVDGGPAARSLRPKLEVFSKHVLTNVGAQVPEIEIKHLVAAAIALKGVGGLLFIFGSSLGAYLLLLHQAVATAILYDFYNYDVDKKEFAQLFIKFTQSLALVGALLFFIGMKNSMPRRQIKKKASKVKAV
ncbi:hypothetical protein L1049_017695 [Liquidambar formosana]|uniref:HR-like lesion-inducer n=1 Tax=Liquidambar formosana TaxID=63359 RepID=A0AAP0S1B0_LIQFO